jgi:hypothetical protein
LLSFDERRKIMEWLLFLGLFALNALIFVLHPNLLSVLAMFVLVLAIGTELERS